MMIVILMMIAAMINSDVIDDDDDGDGIGNRFSGGRISYCSPQGIRS